MNAMPSMEDYPFSVKVHASNVLFTSGVLSPDDLDKKADRCIPYFIIEKNGYVKSVAKHFVVGS